MTVLLQQITKRNHCRSLSNISFLLHALVYWRDGLVVRASASQSGILDLCHLSSHFERREKIIFTAFLLGARYKRDGVENKFHFAILGQDSQWNVFIVMWCNWWQGQADTLPIVVTQAD